MVQAPAKTQLLSEYRDRFSGSLEMNLRAQGSLAGGIAHDGRYMNPFPLYIQRAEGAYKWDIDGHRFIDYAMGHGSLILGHGNPEILAAAHRQLDLGTHFGAGHETEVRWAEQVQRLIPSAERVRFTASGTEANLLAMRLARAYTNKSGILKFEGHFHGWSDYLVKGEKPPFEHPNSPGVPEDVSRTVAVVPSDDLGAVEERLTQGDIAAVIIEPSGASWSMIPLEREFLVNLRELTSSYGVVLIFDEVITGFRWAPGGAQQRFDIIPDMTTLAKIIAGGFPGGAVTGRESIMEHLLFKDDPTWNSTKKVIHPGTYNANPLAAAAGTACLEQCANPAVQEYCDNLASRLRAGLNTTFEEHGVDGCAWGESSVFHLIVGVRCSNRTAGDLRVPEGIAPATLKASGKAGLAQPLAIAMSLEGVDLFAGGGLFSTAHTEEDVDFTVGALSRSLSRLRADGYIA
jgi:glutamate-1-semialdehyde 2,1-aminomutase